MDGAGTVVCLEEGSTGTSVSASWGVRPMVLDVGGSPRMSDSACDDSFISLRNRSRFS